MLLMLFLFFNFVLRTRLKEELSEAIIMVGGQQTANPHEVFHATCLIPPSDNSFEFLLSKDKQLRASVWKNNQKLCRKRPQTLGKYLLIVSGHPTPITKRQFTQQA